MRRARIIRGGDPRRRAGLLLAIVSHVLLGTTAANANSLSADAEVSVTARLQKVVTPSFPDLAKIGNQSVPVAPNYFRVSNQDTTRAYSLDPRHRVPSFETKWHAVPSDTPGLDGIATALWTMAASLPGKDLPSEMEAAARQIAIWAKGGSLLITRKTVPNQRLRNRALALLRAAPETYPPNQQPTSLTLSDFVAHASEDQVEVVIDVSDSLEDTFDEPQRIDLRVDGHWTTLKTGSSFEVGPVVSGKKLRARRGGPSPDYNTSVLVLSDVDTGHAARIFLECHARVWGSAAARWRHFAHHHC